MPKELFAETVTKVDEPDRFFCYLEMQDGSFLGVEEDGQLCVSCVGDDRIIWEELDDKTGFRHVSSGKTVEKVESRGEQICVSHEGEPVTEEEKPDSALAEFKLVRGPADLPSTYLEFLNENGWVCLPSILRPEVVDGLEKVSGVGNYEGTQPEGRRNPIAHDVAVGQAAAEPVSLWLTRQYMRTNQIRFGHPPSLALLSTDDGQRDVQGWHSDFPYLWGIAGPDTDGRIPEHESVGLVLGVQRNICISPFTKEGGATAFKLGSSNLHRGPPREWGRGSDYFPRGHRKEHGLPYNGPEADIVDAPAGSIILYDARTWHRAGVNRTNRLRGAMLQAIIPHFMMPFYDTTSAYRQYLESSVVDQLSMREFYEIESLMLNRMGRTVITVDEELTKAVNPQSEASSSGY